MKILEDLNNELNALRHCLRDIIINGKFTEDLLYEMAAKEKFLLMKIDKYEKKIDS